MMRKMLSGVGVVMCCFAVTTCSQQPMEFTEVARFPIDDMNGVLTTTDVELDQSTMADGNASLKIVSTEPRTVRLFEVQNPRIDDARLVYRAKLRTADVSGRVYLEMLCHFPGMGEFFSRGLEHPLSGSTEWSTEETLFFLQPGERPDRVSLNLVIEGSGTAWIDDVELLKAPLDM